MGKVETWGRKESWIWPPRRFYFTYGTFFLAFVLFGICSYLRFEIALSPLQRYYLPYAIRTQSSSLRQSAGQYQLLYISGPNRPARFALDSDVQVGQTLEQNEHILPLELSYPSEQAHG